ncbi:hypothetical protein [Curtobacterium sp. VKM Ac-1393]|uniref:hypothetical protein n=1 Tax=Curtobacterium sp. VKM Ac-1393 TaxID=2783814 RepID=UPI00188A9112|nr:hypothetical protein [Curtobacterium sp. VKM Ac-1393]MBF4608920.1 hypothetical protein [Curtobacterium sp. VKM Ac-1393]
MKALEDLPHDEPPVKRRLAKTAGVSEAQLYRDRTFLAAVDERKAAFRSDAAAAQRDRDHEVASALVARLRHTVRTMAQVIVELTRVNAALRREVKKLRATQSPGRRDFGSENVVDLPKRKRRRL